MNNSESSGRQRVLQNHVDVCWKNLYWHVMHSKCSCYLSASGDTKIIDCLLGRNAQEEYDLAINRLDEYKAELVECQKIVEVKE